MRAPYGSGDWSEADFVKLFESCQFPNGQFKHGDHIRLAWIYLRQGSYEAAEQRIVASIRRFAGSLGHSEKYHETVTRAWMRLVSSACRSTPDAASFDDFLARNSWLLDRNLLLGFYSKEHLQSDAARAGWREPDLKPLPAAE